MTTTETSACVQKWSVTLWHISETQEQSDPFEDIVWSSLLIAGLRINMILNLKDFL